MQTCELEGNKQLVIVKERRRKNIDYSKKNDADLQSLWRHTAPPEKKAKKNGRSIIHRSRVVTNIKSTSSKNVDFWIFCNLKDAGISGLFAFGFRLLRTNGFFTIRVERSSRLFFLLVGINLPSLCPLLSLLFSLLYNQVLQREYTLLYNRSNYLFY